MNRVFHLTTLLLVLLCLGSAFRLRPAEGGYKVGDKAMNFSLKNVDGKRVALPTAATDKGCIVVFTCNHCPFSQAYEQRIIALHRRYAPQGYPVVAINPNDPALAPDDSFEEMQKRAKQKQYPFPYLLDATQQVAHTYGATRTPHVFVLTRAGADYKVAYIGAIDNNTEDPAAVTTKYVDAAMTQLMAGKPVATPFTKAVGCGIKWKS